MGECLVVRPSWISPNLGPQQVEIVVDPGQAFGTGGHVSTRLALEWIEAVSREESAFCGTTRVLDVGAGTGVLALAAVRLGVGHAIGFDLDPLAGASARETAGRNGLADRFAGFVGLSVPRFEAHFTPCVEVGWRLAPEHWGQGFAAEAAMAALTFGFEQLALREIVSFTVPTNLRSRGLMERIGMTHELADDFDHPMFDISHRLCRHVLYRKPRA